MARVNRTTGFFLILGLAALVGTVAGARWMMQPGEQLIKTETPPTEASVFTSGDVDVLTGLSNLVPNVLAGKVLSVLVKEDDQVKAGQVLVQLDDRPVRDKLKSAEQDLKVASAELDSARKLAADAVKEHDLKVSQQKGLVIQADTNHRLAVSAKKQADEAVSRGLLATAKNEQERADIAVQGARRALQEAEDVLAKLKAIDPTISLRGLEERLKKAEIEFEAAKSALEQYVIKAPSDGTVLQINYKVGGSAPLSPGDPNASHALVFCPNEPLVVRAEIDQEWALMVKPGMKATMTYRGAGRDLKWTGEVEKVASYIQQRRSRVQQPATFNDARTRECIIRINPDPKNPMLLNMPLRVEIHTN